MDSVLTAVVIIFIVLFAVLSLSYATFSSQEMMAVSWQAMQARQDTLSRTQLTPVSAQIVSGGTEIQWSIRNSGQTRLADFQRWDAILQYTDNGSPSSHHINWLAHSTSPLSPGQWQISDIRVDAITPETYEPGILNPGEIVTVVMPVLPPIAPGSTIQLTLATDQGVSVNAFATRNRPPTLTHNLGVSIMAGDTIALTSAELKADDLDNTASQLVYTITTPPGQGLLTLGASFTQADIDNNLLAYSHMGSGTDSFAFTISDGETVIGPYTFVITVP